MGRKVRRSFLFYLAAILSLGHAAGCATTGDGLHTHPRDPGHLIATGEPTDEPIHRVEEDLVVETTGDADRAEQPAAATPNYFVTRWNPLKNEIQTYYVVPADGAARKPVPEAPRQRRWRWRSPTGEYLWPVLVEARRKGLLRGARGRRVSLLVTTDPGVVFQGKSRRPVSTVTSHTGSPKEVRRREVQLPPSYRRWYAWNDVNRLRSGPWPARSTLQKTRAMASVQREIRTEESVQVRVNAVLATLDYVDNGLYQQASVYLRTAIEDLPYEKWSMMALTELARTKTNPLRAKRLLKRTLLKNKELLGSYRRKREQEEAYREQEEAYLQKRLREEDRQEAYWRETEAVTEFEEAEAMLRPMLRRYKELGWNASTPEDLEAALRERMLLKDEIHLRLHIISRRGEWTRYGKTAIACMEAELEHELALFLRHLFQRWEILYDHEARKTRVRKRRHGSKFSSDEVTQIHLHQTLAIESYEEAMHHSTVGGIEPENRWSRRARKQLEALRPDSPGISRPPSLSP